VRDVLDVADLELFGRFLRLCAGRNGQLLNLSSLAGDCGISHSTARRWLDVLETSFLGVRLRPYHRSFNKRLTRSPKLYFLDTGLLCYLLGIRKTDDLLVHPLRGQVFEAFIVSELLKNRVHRDQAPGLFFWRDHRGNEVDVVLDRARGPLALEAKSGRPLAGDHLRGLRHWRRLAGDEAAPACLVYGGDLSMLREGFLVLSWRVL